MWGSLLTIYLLLIDYFFIYQKTNGKHIKYIRILYTPEGILSIDKPVSGLRIMFPIVIPTVPFCILDSIATVTACWLFILNHFELL